MHKPLTATLYAATALAGVTMTPQLAYAQSPAAAADATDVQEITVTARRRDESIVDVPLAITVLSNEKLTKLGITSTSELANYVPGLQFSDFTPGYSRNDRGGTRPLIFRGLNVGTGGSVSAAGGMFLDGAAVVGNEIPGGLDIGAVEVLRGPQSVYFGRSTMTGAVSYRTKKIPDTWGGEIDMTVAERDTYRVEGTVAGPIAPGVLGIRLTGLKESSGGYLRNTYNGGKLGDRSRKSISGSVDFTPTSTLEFKGYANYFEDDDGASATGFLTQSFANCQPAGSAINPAAPRGSVTNRYTFCGDIPSPRNSLNYHNTTIPTRFSDVIFSSPLIAGKGFKKQVGLQRQVLNSHLVSDWQISDYLKVSSITGYHTNVTLQAADGISQAPQPSFLYNQYFYTITNKARDFSQELRLSSNPDKPFSWTAGANYVNAYSAVEAIVAFLDQANGVPTTFRPIPQNIGTEYAKTYGFFGGGYLKLFDDKLTLSAEGRYQIDKRRSRQQTVALVELLSLNDTFRSFNPRVAIDYDLGGDKKVYASYATGTRPGGFNTLLKTYFDRANAASATANDRLVVTQINSLLGLNNTSYKEERLKIAEVGVKGRFDGGKGYFDINTYYGKLTNQQIGYGTLIPALGFTVTATANIGETTVYGVEAQGNYSFDSHFSLSGTFAWNHTNRNKYTNTGGVPQFGTTNFDGVAMANTPEFTGSAVASYEAPISSKLDGFGNVSYVYRGKQYMDLANLSYIHGRSQVDVRAGVKNDTYSIEFFVSNLFNNRYWTGGNVAPDFGGGPTYVAFFGAPAAPRQLGARVGLKF